MLLIWCAWAAAQEPGEERPLAIPDTGPPPVEAPPVEAPRRNPERARARQAYRAQALILRPYSEIYQGATYTRRGLYMPFYVESTALGVFQGRERLDVPQTLGALGDLQGQQALEQRIGRSRGSARLLYGLGAAGLVTSLVGLVALDQVTTREQAQVYGTATLAGLGVAVGGFVVGTFPAGRAWRLQYDLDATQDLDAIEQRIEDHNRALAEELGLPQRRP